MHTVRQERDAVMSTLRRELEAAQPTSRFPLDSAVVGMRKHQRSERMSRALGNLADALDLFEVTSVSAALAIKDLGSVANDTSGIRDALVDLWGRAEAARSLLFDVEAVWTGSARGERELDLWETARLLAPDAIAIAMRLSEPVSQYVEFASKVIGSAGPAGDPNSAEIPRA